LYNPINVNAVFKPLRPVEVHEDFVPDVYDIYVTLPTES
jgi:hypothetical protein